MQVKARHDPKVKMWWRKNVEGQEIEEDFKNTNVTSAQLIFKE